MKILLNTTTLLKGGALQASASFIAEAVKEAGGIAWYLALSKPLAKEVEQLGVVLQPDQATVFEDSPARNREARSDLIKLEKMLIPDAVFTFFGPAYVDFRAPHLCGVADPWVTHCHFLAFRRLGLSRELVEFPMLMLYKGYWYRKADRWVVEAEVARQGLMKRLNLDADKIDIVPNNCGELYLRSESAPKFPTPAEKLRILYLSAYYRHKNFEIIPHVASNLRRQMPGLAFEFVITLPREHSGLARIWELAERLGVTGHIRNVGPVAVSSGPELYKSCHMCFMPSLLEAFSANYPEAMAMGRPIVASDFAFARDICRMAAVYVDPMNARAAASAIGSLIKSRERWEGIVEEGKKVLEEFPSPRKKYEMYRECLEKLCGHVA